jgi:hypothetical protein
VTRRHRDRRWRRYSDYRFAALNALRQAGALPLIDCQLLSMQHIALLGKLAEHQAQAQSTPTLDAHALFGEQDTLSFDWDA